MANAIIEKVKINIYNSMIIYLLYKAQLSSAIRIEQKKYEFMSLNLCHLMENVKNKNEESVEDRKQRYVVIRGKKKTLRLVQNIILAVGYLQISFLKLSLFTYILILLFLLS